MRILTNAMYKCLYRICFIIILFSCVSTNTIGQPLAFREKLVQSLAKDIYKYYVSEELARQMADSIRQKCKTGGYDTSLNGDEFAYAITQDLRRISGDRHILITPPHHDIMKDSLDRALELEKLTEKQRRRYFTKDGGPLKRLDEKYRWLVDQDWVSYGDVDILPGNIGFIQVLSFGLPSSFNVQGKNRLTTQSVFSRLKNVSSVIIDLRENQGGATGQAAKFCSFFSSQPNAYFITEEMFFRYDSNGIAREYTHKRERRTDAEITNSLTKGKGIYILVSGRTFSAAELVAYKIKQFVPAAAIIGEQTKGGGNGYSDVLTSLYYTAIIPSTKAFDENSANYDLEGKGVTPDRLCPADSAFEVAYNLALEGSGLDTVGQTVKHFRKTVPIEVNTNAGAYAYDYVGDYRKVSVYTKDHKLYMLYDLLRKCLLIPVAADSFKTEDFEVICFKRNDNEQVAEVLIKHKDGYLECFRKRR